MALHTADDYLASLAAMGVPAAGIDALRGDVTRACEARAYIGMGVELIANPGFEVRSTNNGPDGIANGGVSNSGIDSPSR